MARETKTLLFKDGDRMGVATDAPDAKAFRESFATVLAGVIERGEFDGDWEFQLSYWLPCYTALTRFFAETQNPTRRWYAVGEGIAMQNAVESDAAIAGSFDTNPGQVEEIADPRL